jgi:ribosomal-protein-alanine N-acetyltransferase
MTPAQLADLHKRCFKIPRPWTAEEFLTLLADPNTLVVRETSGFALGRVIVDEAELLTLAVAPEQRRKGVALRMLLNLEQAAKSRGAATCFLEVAASNTPAIALYHSAGYREAGRRRGYYKQADGMTEDALILSHSLGQD